VSNGADDRAEDVASDNGIEAGRGLVEQETEALAPLLTRIREVLGASMVVIEHDMALVTTVSLHALAAMTGLERLRLADTRITDNTIRALAPLKKLRSLTATGTKVTDESLASLRQKGVAIYADPDVH